MSDDACRGCSSNYAQPISQEDEQAAESIGETVYFYNCRRENQPLDDIVYRTGAENSDILSRVIRWDSRPYTEIFITGFQAWPQEDTPDNIYYDLNQFVQNSGAPLDSVRNSRHVFVSTTLSTTWRLRPSTSTLPPGGEIRIYRYEIYAPGGIWVGCTLTNNQHENQQEICFVGGIAPQYIRSAQEFILTRQPGSQYASERRADNEITINRHFNPLWNVPDWRLLIEKPFHYYKDKDNNNKHTMLSHNAYPPEPNQNMRRKRDVSNVKWDDATFNWYDHAVAEKYSYTITAAFRSSSTDWLGRTRYEAYIFMKNEYALLYYAPGTNDDKIVGQPQLICDGFPSLIGTTFGEHGIDCAFDTDGNNAFIFSSNLCAYIDYAPGTTNDKILSGPMTISDMFPFFKHDKLFENGVDAAFKSIKDDEAYLFRFDQYALINYKSKNLIASGKISVGFPSLVGTIFAEKGIDAAFASHRYNEAYLFKEDCYALIHYVPDGAIDDQYIIGGKVKQSLPNWPSLRSILPRQNAGLDFDDQQSHGQARRREHDEL